MSEKFPVSWFKKWSIFDSARSLGEWLLWGFCQIVGITGAAIISWLFAFWDSYWQIFDKAGYAIAFLVAWIALPIGALFLTELFQRLESLRRGRAKHMPSVDVQQAKNSLVRPAQIPKKTFVQFEFPGRGFGYDSAFRSTIGHLPGTETQQQYEDLWIKITAIQTLRNVSIRIVIRDKNGSRYREHDVNNSFAGTINPEQTTEIIICRRAHRGTQAWLFPDGPNISARIGGQCRVEIIVFHEEGPSRAQFDLSLSNDWERRSQSEISRLQGIEIRPITSKSAGGFFPSGGSIFNSPDFKI